MELCNKAALSVNTWGYSLDSGTSKSWSAVPEVASSSYHPESAIISAGADLISSSSTPNTPSGANVDVYYGVNADTSMPAGTYTTTVTYTAFAEGIPAAYTMQGFSIADCANMETDTTTVLTDTRNGNNYTIVKARDGNCWMADNLSIYDQTISSADSNLPEGTTITLPASSNWNTNDTTNMRIHVADGTGQYADKTGKYYGEVYYNWCSAIGEENCGKYNVRDTIINQSICPKGWRLPIHGDASQNLSYAKLMNAYSVTAGSQLLDSTNPAYVLGFHDYYGTYHWPYSSESFWGIRSFFWISTAYSGVITYDFNYNSTNIYTQDYGDYTGHGFTIRCVQENRTLSDVTYMQDMYDQICANTATGATAQLLDKRGQGNNGTNTTAKYGVLKAKDGNCWMTSNLNLYNKALTPNDTDIPSNITLPASTTWSTDNKITDAMKIHVADGTGAWANKTGEYYGEVYYSWCSAIGKVPCNEGAGVNVNQSICPKNWRLPIGGDTIVNKSWAKLLDAYGVTSGTGTQLMDSSNPAYALGVHKYYGEWRPEYDSEWAQGGNGRFWSSTANSETCAARFLYGTNGAIHQNCDYKGVAFSVRCVLH